MSFLFKKPKNANEIVKLANSALLKLDDKKSVEELSKSLVQIKQVLESEESELIAGLAQEIYNQELLQALVFNIHRMEFEARKNMVLILNTLLQRQTGARQPTVEYICARESILEALMKGYEQSEITLNCGMVLRECLRYEPLCKIILFSRGFWTLFVHVQSQTFEVASDAFATFKDLLTMHKVTVSQFLEAEYEEFMLQYNTLLQSDNYVTKRQSIKLLGEILLDRNNFVVMQRYISLSDNLILMMNLMKDKSKNIQFEAFHVFKIFVLNPTKSTSVTEILLKNKDKICDYIKNFNLEKQSAEFLDLKSQVLVNIQQI